MQAKRQFKIGLVGCGRISQSYVESMKHCSGVKLVAVMDTRREAAASAAEAAECRAFSDIEAFASESGIEGAIICAPPASHKSVACTLMQQGIHVLCEKPFSTNYEDARAMMDMSIAKNVELMMASKFRYVEDIIRAKAMITSGMMGDILFYTNVFCSNVDMRGRWNADPNIGGGGVLIDNGTHSVDIVRYLLGPIQSVYVHDSKQVMGLPVEDSTALSFTTQGGVTGTIYLSWGINIDQPGYIDIFGTEGKLSIGWKESKYQHNGHREWVSFGVGYNKINAFRDLILNFVDTVRGAANPVIMDEDALASVQVIEAAYQSLRSHNLQTVEEKDTTCLLTAS